MVATTYTASLDTVLSLPTAMLADIPGIGRRTAGIFTATEAMSAPWHLLTCPDFRLLRWGPFMGRDLCLEFE
ncbi:MAG: hypothetical protein EPN45_04365 [Rhizobiaceae bacterium]|nr:MAG: hypothetical protein EPN45_04365 [Rhizobiaceae bacterium]